MQILMLKGSPNKVLHGVPMEFCWANGRYIFGHDYLNERCGDKTQMSFVPCTLFFEKM